MRSRRNNTTLTRKVDKWNPRAENAKIPGSGRAN